MRHVLLVCAVAVAVIGVWWFLSGGIGYNPGPLPADLGVFSDISIDDDPASRRIDGGAAALAPTAASRNSTPVRPATALDLAGLCKQQGVVGEATYAMISKTVGQGDVRLLDRSFASQDISRIINAWQRDPKRKDADIKFLLKVWEQMEDPTARWALSFLFSRAKDDRVITALTDMLPEHPTRALAAIADQNSPAAATTLQEVAQFLEKPELRSFAYVRIGQGVGEGRLDYLKDVSSNRDLSDHERFVAMEVLAQMKNEPDATLHAFQVATGEPQPVGSLGRDRQGDHPIQDLRSAAVMGIMQSGDQTLSRKLLDAADDSNADPSLTKMVDLHIGTYRGPDLTELLFSRTERRRKVSLGEARYFNAVAGRSSIEALRRLLPYAESPKARKMLEAALLNAAVRE